MKYNLNSLEKKFKVELDDIQKHTLEELIKFVESPSAKIQCLSGRAGTGKTTIIKMFRAILDDNGYHYMCLAPTNKSAGVCGPNTGTIHKYLNLRPEIDITDYDATQLTFDFGKIKPRTMFLLIVDECSMVNDDLFKELSKHCVKLLAVGDSKQLAPVKQGYISTIFNNPTIELTKIYRQPESCIQKVLEYLRKKPLYKFKEISDEGGSIIIHNNINKMLKQYSYLFKVSSDFDDKNLCKIITYTNNRVEALNNVVRKYLYSDTEEYHVGEVLTGYDTCTYGGYSIENSKDYIVKKCWIEKWSNLNVWMLTLDSGESIFTVRVLSKNNSKEELSNLTQRLEEYRLKAVDSKQSIDWAHYYALYGSFLTPIDLVYENRVVRRKTIDYGYCISAHKSQASTYNIVLVDMENLWRCTNLEELRQLQYVACSRTSGSLIIYQQDDKISI